MTITIKGRDAGRVLSFEDTNQVLTLEQKASGEFTISNEDETWIMIKLMRITGVSSKEITPEQIRDGDKLDIFVWNSVGGNELMKLEIVSVN